MAVANLTATQRGRTVHINFRRISGLLIVTILLIACTRNRPAAEPTATLNLPTAPILATKSGVDPGVTVITDTTSVSTSESGIAVAAETPTPAASQAADTASKPTPATFDYIVKFGQRKCCHPPDN